jgi:hypothetical protein
MIECYEYLIPFGDNLGFKMHNFSTNMSPAQAGWSWPIVNVFLHREYLPKGCTKGIPSGPSARIICVYLRPLLPWNL